MKINQFTKNVILLIFVAEILSALGYFIPLVNNLSFVIFTILAIALSIVKLEYGIYLALTELFVGTMGKLFYLEVGGVSLSIRISIWVIIMSVWLAKNIIYYINNKKIIPGIFTSSHFKYFLIFFIFIIWGVVSGYLNNNNFGNIFFDFNGWLYFGYVFPLYEIFANSNYEKIKNEVINLFLIACSWISFKTLFLLYLFSHETVVANYGLYFWMRKNQLGEITRMNNDFFRIFIQSQIYVLIGLFIVAVAMFKKRLPMQKGLLWLTLFISVIVVGMSRSFWVGGAIATIIFCVLYFKDIVNDWKWFVKFSSYILLSLILSLALMVVVVKFPWPGAGSSANGIDLLAQRAGQVRGEDGASSRWSLLPELLKSIKSQPFLGKGFGATVTYTSSDPRVLESSPTGKYTTYAFEWGWLDIWLKFGFFGLIAYLLLMSRIVFDAYVCGKKDVENSCLYFGLIICYISICGVSFFSPYTNHPLGIGFLLLTGAIISGAKSKLLLFSK